MVKRIFDVDQLHLQIVLCDALDGDVKRFLLALLVALLGEQILLRRHADDWLERRDYALIVNLHHAGHTFAQLHAARSLRHHVHTRMQLIAARIKIIQLAGALEAHPDYHGHLAYSSDISSRIDSNAEANDTLLPSIMRALVI